MKRTFDLRPQDHPAHGAWQVAFDAANSWAPRDAHKAQFCADLAALSLAGDAHRCSRRDERDAEAACLRLVPQTYEDLRGPPFTLELFGAAPGMGPRVQKDCR